MLKSQVGLLAAMIMGSLAMASPIQDGPRPGPTPMRGLRRGFKPAAAPTYANRSKRYQQMVTSSDAEIAEWNRNVNTRQVRRRALHGHFVQS